jgi:hypothetical protein
VTRVDVVVDRERHHLGLAVVVGAMAMFKR